MLKFCKNCQTETERYTDERCKKCICKRLSEWRKLNPQKAKEKDAAYYKAHTKQINARSAVWRAAHPCEGAATAAAWRDKNLERHKEVCALWRDKNKEKLKSDKSTYYKANSIKIASYRVVYNKLNQDKIREARSAYYAANAEKIITAGREYNKEHPEVRRISHQNRRARKRANGGKLSQGLIEKLFILQRGKCACCAKPLNNNYHLDHRMPLALGGINEDLNMQLLTAKCNMQKSAKHPVDFMQSRGFLI